MIELRQRGSARNGYHRISSEEDLQSIPRLNNSLEGKSKSIAIHKQPSNSCTS